MYISLNPLDCIQMGNSLQLDLNYITYLITNNFNTVTKISLNNVVCGRGKTLFQSNFKADDYIHVQHAMGSGRHLSLPSSYFTHTISKYTQSVHFSQVKEKQINSHLYILEFLITLSGKRRVLFQIIAKLRTKMNLTFQKMKFKSPFTLKNNYFPIIFE